MRKKNRSGNYELMRIVAAILIVLNHIDIQFEALDNGMLSTINSYIVHFFHMGGKFGVNLFVLLGLWFLYDKPLKIQVLFRMLSDVMIYGTIMYLFATMCGRQLSGLRGFIKSYSYWFPFAYTIVVCVVPLVHSISKNRKRLVVILIVGAVFFTLLTGLSVIYSSNSIIAFICKETVIGPFWFIYVCFLINYVKCKPLFHLSSFKLFVLWMFLYAFMYVAVLVFEASALRDMYSPVCFLASLVAFYFFSSIQIECTEIIERIASCSFGPYLVQCNNHFRWIWNNEVFSYTSHANSLAFCFVVIISIFAYYVIAMIIQRACFLLDHSVSACNRIIRSK